MTATLSPGRKMQAHITALLKSRHPVLAIKTPEEYRAGRMAVESAAGAGMVVEFWDCVDGHTNVDGASINRDRRNPAVMFQHIRERDARVLFVFRDIQDRWFDQVTTRWIRTLATLLQSRPPDKQSAILLLSPKPLSELSAEIQAVATCLDWPLPDRDELGELVDDAVDSVDARIKPKVLDSLKDGGREAAINALLGLNSNQAADGIALSIAATGTIDVRRLADAKCQLVSSTPGLSVFEPNPLGFEAMGGNRGIKDYMLKLAVAFTDKARKSGMPPPRGCLLVGVSGTGKTLTAKCAATVLRKILLQCDIAGTREKWVGSSEQNLAAMVKMASTMGGIMLLDEIEKMLGGATAQQGDGGVSSNELRTLLVQMQDGLDGVYIIATCNDVKRLPPELIGRFDVTFFVDLPKPGERAEIITAAMREVGRKLSAADAATVAVATHEFTGREIARLVKTGMLDAVNEDRDVNVRDLLAAAAATVPLSMTKSEDIAALRQWAVGRAVPAAGVEQQETRRSSNVARRQINLDVSN